GGLGAAVAEVPLIREARARRGAVERHRRALVGRLVRAGVGRRQGVHHHRGRVVGEAAVLVRDASGDRVVAGGRERGGGRGGARVDDVEGAVVVEVVAVPEAGAGVGRRRVRRVGEREGHRGAWVHRAVVAEARGRRHVVDGDGGAVLGGAAGRVGHGQG